jgi:CubicO group peptidase (beta-lactamase class C family)
VSGDRVLPGQASLRHLKLEAKRRRAAGEFPTLHDAQFAIAREHGQPSWAVLREAVGAAAGNEGRAVTQLWWIVARFRDAAEPGWAAPGGDELREHFTAQFLAAVPPDRLITLITEVVCAPGGDLVIVGQTQFTALGQLAGHLVRAETEERAPFRLAGVQASSLGERISDPRTTAPPAATAGPVPGKVPALAAEAVAGLGLVGLALAGASAGGDAWAAAAGWASLERAEPLSTDHLFPACYVTTVVTATAVLCLAAAGRLRLDDRANSHLTTVRLADDTVTIRDLLTHTAGVSAPAESSAPAVPGLAPRTGPVIACDGKRGTFGPSPAGYAALGEVIAGRTGLSYQEAATQLVLRPLGMHQSRFPVTRPAAAVTCYDVAADETFTPVDGTVSIFPAAGGLWTTATDLARFGLGWRTLVPRSLAAQAIRPHARQANGIHVGFGWAVNEPAGLIGVAGEGPGAAASLLVSLDGGHASAAMASRRLFVEPVNAAVFQLLGGGGMRID